MGKCCQYEGLRSDRTDERGLRSGQQRRREIYRYINEATAVGAHHKRKREMRQATTYTRVSALVAACTALLAACGGSDSSGGTVQSIDFAYPGPHYMLDAP